MEWLAMLCLLFGQLATLVSFQFQHWYQRCITRGPAKKNKHIQLGPWLFVGPDDFGPPFSALHFARKPSKTWRPRWRYAVTSLAPRPCSGKPCDWWWGTQVEGFDWPWTTDCHGGNQRKSREHDIYFIVGSTTPGMPVANFQRFSSWFPNLNM